MTLAVVQIRPMHLDNSRIMPIVKKKGNIRLNKALWTLTEKMANIKNQ